MNNEPTRFSIDPTQSGILSLGHQHIGDDEIKSLVYEVLKNKNIIHIDLSHNDLSDNSLIYLETLLNHHQNLTHLKLSHNAFSTDGITTLSDYLKRSLALIHFECDNELVQNDTRENLKKLIALHQKTPNGIVNSGNEQLKQDFLENYWAPFRETLTELLHLVKMRSKKKFSLNDRLPSQRTILELQQQCLHLTEIWYGMGKGNLSALYSYFYVMCEEAGLTVYAYRDLPIYQSKDGYLSNIDNSMRREAKTHYDEKIKKPYLQVGGIQQQHSSVIDDLSLNHLHFFDDADKILTIHYMKQLVVQRIHQEQLMILQTIQQEKNIKEEELLQKETIDSLIHQLTGDDLPTQLLKQYGAAVENWGQLPESIQVDLYQTFEELFNEEKMMSAPKSSEAGSLYMDFMQFVENNPGKIYDKIDQLKSLLPNVEQLGSAQKIHQLVQTMGIISGELAMVKRNTMEAFNLQRYLVLPWVRQHPLSIINKDGNKQLLAPIGSQTQLRIRVNNLPYKPMHSLSVVASDFVAKKFQDSADEYDWNLPLEQEIPQMNNLVRDIEKIIAETLLMNPRGKEEDMLPGEMFFECLQNIASESSVQETLHLHLAAGLLADYPLYTEENNPIVRDDLQATVDLVQLGDDPDCFFMKFISSEPYNYPLIHTLISIMHNFSITFASEQEIDFGIHCLPVGNGQFCIVFYPLAKIEKQDGQFINTITKQTFTKLGNPRRRLPFGTVPDEHPINQGRNALVAYFNAIRLPNSRACIDDFLSKL